VTSRPGSQDRSSPRPSTTPDRPNRDQDRTFRATGKLYWVIDVTDNSSAPRLVIFDLDGTLYPREMYAELILAVIAEGSLSCEEPHPVTRPGRLPNCGS
jgi:hypothetical protein